jgi:hypothetical protein
MRGRAHRRTQRQRKIDSVRWWVVRVDDSGASVARRATHPKADCQCCRNPRQMREGPSFTERRQAPYFGRGVTT